MTGPLPFHRQKWAREAALAQLGVAEREITTSKVDGRVWSLTSARKKASADVRDEKMEGTLEGVVTDRELAAANQRLREKAIEAEESKRQMKEAHLRLRDAGFEATWKRKIKEGQGIQQMRDRQALFVYRHQRAKADYWKEVFEQEATRHSHGPRIRDEASAAFEALHHCHHDHFDAECGALQRRVRASEFPEKSCLPEAEKTRLESRWTSRSGLDLERGAQALADRHH
mmetsp:Transcript_71394/g.149187  ORF Transcript_71394/g.149187 Transcript_71394/m.149187 type:complete len:229 (+) Transcript_71394:72-758(+)